MKSSIGFVVGFAGGVWLMGAVVEFIHNRDGNLNSLD
jgi:hypothetical protein